MKTTNSLALVLSLVLGATAVGCGSDPSTMPGDDDGGGGGGAGGGGGGGTTQPPAPLDATGKYAVHSTFDLATNMPGTAGTVVNTIIAATDGPNDPTDWLVSQIIAQLPDGTAKTALNIGKNLVVGYLNDRLLQFAPDFVSTLVQVGNDFGDIAKHFGLNETLDLSHAGSDYVAVHTVTGAHFKLDNQEGDYALATNIVVNNVAVTMNATGQLTIATHDVSLAYGKLLRLGLDAAIIPAIDPSAHNLNQLLANKLDCQVVGNLVDEVLGFGSTVAAACALGINVGANYVYTKIDAIDGSALQFGLSGTARALDNNNDRKIDAIQAGTWSGTLAYGATPTPLVPATFTGVRM